MFYRQRLLLSLIEEFGGCLHATDLQKYLFLYTKLYQKDKSYEFIPYKYGCVSLQSYVDKNKLIELGYLDDSTDWIVNRREKHNHPTLKKDELNTLKLFKNKYEHLKGKELIKYVYKNYPYYAVNSIIASDLLSKKDLDAIKKAVTKKRKSIFSTIGYEGITIENYLNKLITNDIRLLIDVRKNPLSRKYGFSKKSLTDALNKVGIEYIHIPDLGITSDKRKNLNSEKDYLKLFSNYEKTVLDKSNLALSNLYNLYKINKRVAITCYEECHTMCHRGRIVNYLQSISDNTLKVVHL